MRVNRFLLVLALLAQFAALRAQHTKSDTMSLVPVEVPPSLVKWYTIEQADVLMKTAPRPLMVDMYTDWCGWCKHLMKTTFANPTVAGYLNAYFYPVRFDAEGRDTVVYNGKTYVNDEAGDKGKHQLAKELMNGRMAFPTLVFVNTEYQAFAVPGYQDVKGFEPLMYFFAEEIYKNTTYEYFEANFKIAFDQTDTIPDKEYLTSGKVNWLDVETAFAQSANTPKPVFIDFYADIYVSSLVMAKATYLHPKVATALNEYFYPVRFSASSQDTVNILGRTFVNAGQGAWSLHGFPAAFMFNNRVELPLLVILDANGQLIQRVPGFFDPVTFERILIYFGKGHYLSQDWEAFVKSQEE